MQMLIIIQMTRSNVLVIYSNTFSYYSAGVSKLLLHSEGFTKRTILSIESLKQVVRGHSPSGYLILFSTKIPCIAPLTLCMNNYIDNLHNKLKYELLLHCVSVCI